jgi:outer membrane receptor protein involved in Fe transport
MPCAFASRARCGVSTLEGQLKRVIRPLAVILMASFLFAPGGARANTATSVVAQATSSTAAVSGTVRDETGAPISGAAVTLRGAQSVSTTSDAKGTFTFSDVAAGLYQITVTKPGYQEAVESDLALTAGQTQNVAVTLPRVTFTALRTIATVRSVGAATFNTTPAAVNTVTNQEFLNQGATGVSSVLNEVPGLQVSLSANDTNGAAPGSITYANIRDGLSFETATEIDGHPLSVGKYGDYVLSFWTPFVFENFDTIKGPGAEATQTNYAINGTLNMRTIDPTEQFETSFLMGALSYGGTYFNWRATGTTGRLGFVADIGEVDQESPLDNIRVELGNTDGGYLPNGTPLGYNNSLSPVPGTSVSTYNNYSLLTCCYTVSGSLNRLNELLKLRYHFSGATVATVSYLGSQATSDENGDTLEMTPSVFQPGAGYTESSPALGEHVLVSNVYPAPDIETNNEPLFQAEVSSTLGQDTVLARYYHTAIQRFISQGNSNPNQPNVEFDTLNGTLSSGQPFNNFYTPVDWYEYFIESEDDSLGGVDLEYQHPYGVGDVLTASYSRVNSQTSYWEAEADTDGYPVVTAGTQDVTIPQGTSQDFFTYRLSDTQNFGDKWNMRLSLYQNDYALTAATICGIGASYTGDGKQCLLDGSNADFRTTNPTHFDERMGLTYRPDTNLVFRASAGSSIAPPYSGLMSKFDSIPSCKGACSSTQPITISLNNPNLVPETAFGYDLGSDFRPRPNYYVSADAYLTNLYNQFLTTNAFAGYCTSQLYPASPCGPAGSLTSPPLYFSINGNVNNARYEGIELTLRHVVTDGIGWLVQGSTQRGYAYNLGNSFYCSDLPTTVPCVPANYNENLGVVANQNFTGGGASTYYVHSGACPATDYYCVEDGANGVSNQNVPYLQGYAEINWQNAKGWYASFGETLFGKNNSYNEPPFTVARVTVRAPLSKNLSFQVSGYNIFNQYNSFFPIVAGGVGIPLANGGVVPSLGNVVGPDTWSVQLKDVVGGSL